MPNVMGCSYYFPHVEDLRDGSGGEALLRTWPSELEPYVPNKFYQPLDATEAPEEDCLVRAFRCVCACSARMACGALC